MSLYAKLKTAVAKSHERLPNMPTGTYECVIEEVREINATDPKKKGNVYFAADLRVLSGPRAGERTSFFCQVEGSGFPDQLETDAASIRSFAAASLGMDPRAEDIMDQDWGTVIPGLFHRDQPVKGHVISVSFSYKAKNEAGLKFPIYGFSPVLENGEPKKISISGIAVPKSAAKKTSLPPPPPAPATPVDIAPPAVPFEVQAEQAGYKPHPQAAGFYYKGQTVLKEEALRAALALGKA